MWAMGVLLYTMIYGQFPFYDNDPQELFRKIKTAKYTIPRYVILTTCHDMSHDVTRAVL